ncbi:hypothetical protein WJX73_009967 [Symbiochloris irregularis]|uniref:Vesicle-fusing ATPase n=1 Tax=Symbiochloris irregularis TaxID=706552 RepID=A0AAW1PUV0_9CHLO
MAAAAYQLAVGNAPAKELAVTNEVYVCPQDDVARCHEVEFSGFVFTSRPHAGMPPHSIGMNQIQRKVAKVSVGDVVAVQPFVAPANFNIVLLHVQISYTAKAAKMASTIEAVGLSGWLGKRFGGQVLTETQTVVYEYEGTNMCFVVTGVTVLDKMNGQVQTSRGRLTPDTAFVFDAMQGSNITITGQRNIAPPQLFKGKFDFNKLGIGGLDAQFDTIFRRAFQSRVVPPSIVERSGMKHVKGLLLHGPPGTGKTLIARQIGKMLNGREPKVVNGPEILNKYVGASEENVRKLFADAEADQLARGENSDLHVIIFDEIDAICKSRGSVSSGTGVNDSVVNQLLTKIDGVDALNNILLIGMTNRKDMLDEALLRPGRLELQVEIGLPDQAGRLQIFKIHMNHMQSNSFVAPDVDLIALSERTKNFSGAEIEGLIRNTWSFALDRQVDRSNLSMPIDEDNLKVTMADFLLALQEVKPAFGAVTETLNSYRLHGITDWGPSFQHLSAKCRLLVEQVRTSVHTPILTLLLSGQPGVGKTALAATLGIDSDFPFVKVVSADNMVGYSESAKVNAIVKVFEDAYKSLLSIVVLDDIERLLEFVAIGPRFSNVILQTLLVLLKKQPPEGRRLLVVGTTSNAGFMEDLGLGHVFTDSARVPCLKEADIRSVLVQRKAFSPAEVDMAVAGLIDSEIPIKRLLMLVERARQGVPPGSTIPFPNWSSVIQNTLS